MGAKLAQVQQWLFDFKENGPYDGDMENVAKLGWYFNNMMLPRDFVKVVALIRDNDIEQLDAFFWLIEDDISEYREYCTGRISEAPERSRSHKELFMIGGNFS